MFINISFISFSVIGTYSITTRAKKTNSKIATKTNITMFFIIVVVTCLDGDMLYAIPVITIVMTNVTIKIQSKFPIKRYC